MCALSASCFHLLWIVLSFWIWDIHPSFSWYHTNLFVLKHDVVPEQQLGCLEWKGIKIHSWNNGSDSVILQFAVMSCIHFNGISNQEHQIKRKQQCQFGIYYGFRMKEKINNYFMFWQLKQMESPVIYICLLWMIIMGHAINLVCTR